MVMQAAKTDIADKLAEALDTFIRNTGGNLDHRANSNKTRKELIKFWNRCLAIMPSDHYGSMDMDRAFKKVLDERLPKIHLSRE